MPDGRDLSQIEATELRRRLATGQSAEILRKDGTTWIVSKGDHLLDRFTGHSGKVEGWDDPVCWDDEEGRHVRAFEGEAEVLYRAVRIRRDIDAVLLQCTDLEPATSGERPRGSPKLQGRAVEFLGSLKPMHAIKPVLSSRALVKGWIDRGAFSVVYGEPNVGKTFLALDLAMHVSAAQSWHGHNVADTVGPIIYVDADGGVGIHNRIEAIRRGLPQLIEQPQTGGFHLLPQTLDLCAGGDAEALARAFATLEAPPVLIVVDTLARAFGGGDENTAKDMGAFIRSVDVLRAETGAHVMVIHHSGKDASKGARGSGALRGAADTEIELTREGDVITAEAKKQRDMPTGAVFYYTLRSVLIGHDDDNEPVFSKVVEPAEVPAKRAPKLKGQKLIAMQALDDALAHHGQIQRGEAFPQNRHCVSLERWREYCDRHSLSSGDGDSSRRAAFYKARTDLHTQGMVRIVDSYVWRCEE